MALCVLLLAVLDLLLADGALAAQLGVDVLLLGACVSHVECREGLPNRVAVAARVAQVTSARFTAPVVLPCDPGCSVLRNAAVDVVDGRITPRELIARVEAQLALARLRAEPASARGSDA